MDSKLFVMAIEMGFSDKDIRLSAEYRKTLGLSNFSNIEELLEALTCLQPTASSAAGPSKKPIIEDPKICVVCMDNNYDTLFNPCNHLVVCGECATNCRDCPMSILKITGYVKVFTP